MPASAVTRTPLETRLRHLTVLSVEDLSPSMRRIRLGGPELEGFGCSGPSDHAKVFFPTEPDGTPALPELADGRLVDRFDPRYVCREYTVRTWDPTAGCLVLDMALHDHGPAGRWAARAEPGRTLGVFGPKTSTMPPLDRDWYLLVADETGLPALTNWLELLRDRGAQVRAVVEVDGPQDQVPLPLPEGTDLTWVHRSGAPAGTTNLLVDAVREHPLPDLRAADGEPRGWAWAGAEAGAVAAVRSTLTGLGLERTSMSMTGYWRHGTANFDHKTPLG